MIFFFSILGTRPRSATRFSPTAGRLLLQRPGPTRRASDQSHSQALQPRVRRLQFPRSRHRRPQSPPPKSQDLHADEDDRVRPGGAFRLHIQRPSRHGATFDGLYHSPEHPGRRGLWAVAAGRAAPTVLSPRAQRRAARIFRQSSWRVTVGGRADRQLHLDQHGPRHRRGVFHCE